MASSKIKWFSSANKNAPALANTWGSMLSVFQACLVDGYSQQSVNSASVVGTDNGTATLVTFTYTAVHGYLQYQHITISGSEVASLNKEFRILSVSSDGLSLTFKIKESLASVGNVISISTKLGSLGWDNVYSETGRAVYRTKSTTDPNHCFFVQDRLNTGYTTTYAKYATTALAEDFNGFAPKGLAVPQDFSLLSGSGSGTTFKLGYGKIFYSSNNAVTTGTVTPTSTPTSGNLEWILIGTEEYFYFFNTTLVGNGYGQLSGFGIYDTIHQGFKYNTFISNMLWDEQLANNGASLSIDCAGLSSNTKYLRTLGIYGKAQANVLYSNSYNGISYSGYSNILGTAGPVNLFKVFLRDPNAVLMGTLKGLYWIAQTTPYNHKQIFKQGSSLYMAFTTYNNNLICQTAIQIGDLDE